MIARVLLTSFVFVAITTIGFAQYQEFYQSEYMESGIEDPSFEFPFSSRPNPDRLYTTQNVLGWSGTIESLTRSWVGTPDEERVLGRKLLRIQGQGAVASWFPIKSQGVLFTEPGITLGHYVTVRASRQGSTEAAFGINYFDANWNQIAQRSALITGSEIGVSRGDGDLLKKYTLAVRTPRLAVYGQVWIASAYPNGTTTFDFLSVFTESSTTWNHSENPYASLIRNNDFVGDFDYQTTGYEFWNAIPGSEPGIQVDEWMPEFDFDMKALLLGQPGRVTNMYQVIDVVPNQPYSLHLYVGDRANPFTASARGWFGIDYFNRAGTKVDEQVFDISQGIFVDDATYTPASDVDFAIAWFYVEPLFRDEVIPVSSVRLHIPYFVPEQSATASSTTSTVKKSKRPAGAPRSPITPAIAQQAIKSISAYSDASTTPIVIKKPKSKKSIVRAPSSK